MGKGGKPTLAPSLSTAVLGSVQALKCIGSGDAATLPLDLLPICLPPVISPIANGRSKVHGIFVKQIYNLLPLGGNQRVIKLDVDGLKY